MLQFEQLVIPSRGEQNSPGQKPGLVRASAMARLSFVRALPCLGDSQWLRSSA